MKTHEFKIEFMSYSPLLGLLMTQYDTQNEDTKKWIHTETDLSSEDSDVKSVCEAVWTNDVKANFKTWRETQI